MDFTLDLIPEGVSSSDTTDPTVGNSGTLSTSSINSGGFTVDYTKATDNESTQPNLRYYLYVSTSDNVGTVTDAEANGTLQNSGGTLDVASLTASGLTASTTYYFNIVVEDEAGNKSVYTSNNVTTLASGGSGLDSKAGDEAALEALYTSTNGASWTDNTGWASSGMDLSNTIYGVTTESIGGELRVTRVKLNGTTGYESSTPYIRGVNGTVGGNNLTGTLPAELGNLKKCKYFNVKQNNLDTSIPPELFTMSSAVRILLNGRLFDLHNNHNPNYNKTTPDESSNILTGNIPDFSNCPNLRFLEIRGEASSVPERGVGVSGRLTGSIPASIQNTSLEGIACGFNAIDNFPSEIGNLNIIQLFAKANAFEGKQFPSTASNWTNLNSLEISRCNFTGAFPDLSNTTIRNLWASINDFTSGFPHYFFDGSNQPNLDDVNTLELAWNNNWNPTFSNNTFDILAPNNIRSLTMEGFDLTGVHLGDISSVDDMINFGFGWTGIGGPLPDFTGFFNLRYLRFASANINGKLPYTIGNITSESFRLLRIDDANLTSYEISPDGHGAISPVVFSDGSYESGLRGITDIRFNANDFTQTDLDNIILDLEANIQSRKGTAYEETGSINISNQTTGATPSNTTEINNAITYIQNEGWTITT